MKQKRPLFGKFGNFSNLGYNVYNGLIARCTMVYLGYFK